MPSTASLRSGNPLRSDHHTALMACAESLISCDFAPSDGRLGRHRPAARVHPRPSPWRAGTGFGSTAARTAHVENVVDGDSVIVVCDYTHEDLVTGAA
jgi:hypothetical protein